MRPQKFDPRGDYRRQENQRIEASVSLSEKFRELKSLTAELAYFNPDGVRRNGEMKCTFDPDKNKSVVRFDCCNHECVGGDFDLSEVLAQAIAQRRSVVTGEMCCQGWLSKTTIDEVRCHHVLRYKLKLAYGKRASAGINPLPTSLTQVISNPSHSTGTGRAGVPAQVIPFAKAQRGAKSDKRVELV